MVLSLSTNDFDWETLRFSIDLINWSERVSNLFSISLLLVLFVLNYSLDWDETSESLEIIWTAIYSEAILVVVNNCSKDDVFSVRVADETHFPTFLSNIKVLVPQD